MTTDIDYKGRLGTAVLILDRIEQAWRSYVGAEPGQYGRECPTCRRLVFGDSALEGAARELVAALRQAHELVHGYDETTEAGEAS